MRQIRFRCGKALALLAAILVPSIGATPASADLNQVLCLGTANQQFDPAVDGTPDTTSIDAHAAYMPGLSCSTLFSPASGRSTIEWNTGEKSTYTFSTTVEFVEGQAIVTSTGSVVDGKFRGATVVRLVTYVQADVLNNGCLAPGGLSSNAGPAILTIAL